MATTTDILRDYLEVKNPLTIVTLQELYDTFPDIPHGRIISTMHRLCLGTIVSGKNRRSFYYAIQMTLNTGKVFSDESVVMLKEKIRTDDAHSSHKFIVTLCNAHDKHLQNTIRQAVMTGKAGRDSASPMSLFQSDTNC